MDEAFFKKLAAAKRLSKHELEELERILLGQPAPGVADPLDPLFKRLAKEKPFLTAKELMLEDGRRGEVLSWRKPVKCLPSPDQLRKGDKTPQTVQEGVSIVIDVGISADRRYVRVKFTETSTELEGVDQVDVVLDDGTEAVAEVPFLKEASHSQVRDIPDGGSLLVPIQYRSREAKAAERWLVLLITPRIRIEEEERLLRKN